MKNSQNWGPTTAFKKISIVNNKFASLCTRTGPFQVEHLLKYFNSPPHRKCHFTFFVSRIRCRSPWKQEVEPICPLFHFHQCWLIVAFWAFHYSCFSKCCENSFHFHRWGGWWYQGICTISRKVKDKGYPGAAHAVLQFTLSWTSLLGTVCPQHCLQLWNSELCLGCCELQHGTVTHGSLSGTQAMEELALSTPARFCCDFTDILSCSASKDMRLMGLLLIHEEDNLGCIYFGAKFLLATETVLPSMCLRVFNISVKSTLKEKWISS